MSLARWFSLLLLVIACAAAAKATDVSSFLLQGDAHYAKRTDLPEVKIALFYYETAMRSDPPTAEPYWKGSRAEWWLGDQAASRTEKLEHFQKGIVFAQAAVEKDSHCVEGYFWLGVNKGAYGEAKGILKSLSLIKPIRRDMAEVQRLNDHFLGGGCYRVLGVVDYKVPGIAGGSKKRALEELQRALGIDSQNPFTHYYLAEYYKTVGDREKARAELNTLQALKVTPDAVPDLEMLQKKGEALAAKL